MDWLYRFLRGVFGQGIANLWIAWKIILALIIIGWVQAHFGNTKLGALVALVMIYFFVFVHPIGFSIIYLVIMFFVMWQGLFFIQMLYSQYRMHKQEIEMMKAGEKGAVAPEDLERQMMMQRILMGG